MGFDESTLLFSEPSFIRGLGRAIDLGATRNQYNDSETPEEADVRAMRSDWVSVGKDIMTSISSFSLDKR